MQTRRSDYRIAIDNTVQAHIFRSLAEVKAAKYAALKDGYKVALIKLPTA